MIRDRLLLYGGPNLAIQHENTGTGALRSN